MWATRAFMHTCVWAKRAVMDGDLDGRHHVDGVDEWRAGVTGMRSSDAREAGKRAHLSGDGDAFFPDAPHALSAEKLAPQTHGLLRLGKNCFVSGEKFSAETVRK